MRLSSAIETLETLAIFIIVLSMLSFPETLPTHGDPSTCLTSTLPANTSECFWSPAGPSSDQILYRFYNDQTAELNSMCVNQASNCTPQIDLMDQPCSYSYPSCPSSSDSRFWLTPPTPQYEVVSLDFNLGNNFFGVTLCNGADAITVGSTCNDGPGATPVNATCPGTIYRTGTALDCSRAGIAIRQGIAHLIDKQTFAQTVFNSYSQSGVALDNPVSAAQGVLHSGYPFDINNPSSQLGAYAVDPTLPVGVQTVPLGSEPPCTTVAQQAGNGGHCQLSIDGVCSWDLLGECGVSAFHLGGDGLANGGPFGGTVNPGTPDFCAAAQLWVNAGLGTGVDTPANGCRILGWRGTGYITLVDVQTFFARPILYAVGQSICQMIHGPTYQSCTEVSVPLLGLCCYSLAPRTGCINASEPNTNCTTQGPDPRWNIYVHPIYLNTAEPNQMWRLYTSKFASDLCGGPPNQQGANYLYLCNSTFDYWANSTEFDNSPGAAEAGLQVAMDIFGNHTYSIPIFNPSFQSAFVKGWTGVSNPAGIGPGNYWSLLNMWNPSPTVLGPTVRWGQSGNTTYLNPFLYGNFANGDNVQVESNILSEIYDTLLVTNPYNPTQLFGWMANSYSIVTNSQDSNCPADVTRNSASFPVAGCIKLSLRGDISWHDIMNCPSTDSVCIETHTVTASDIKFSFAALNSTAGLVGPPTFNTVDVVYNPSVLPGAAFSSSGGMESPGQPEMIYIALKSLSAWAPFDIAGIPILPQHIWATASSTGPCLELDTPQCKIDPNYLTGMGADPVATDKLIGSGPFACSSGPLSSSGTIIGGGCAFDSTGAPVGQAIPAGGSAILRRFNVGLNLNFAYFRTNSKFKNFAWADYLSSRGSGLPNGLGAQGIIDIRDIQSVASCLHVAPPYASAPCNHWSAPAATLTCVSTAGSCFGTVNGGRGNAVQVSIGMVAQVARWYSDQWTDTFTGLGPTPLLYGISGNQLAGALQAPGSGLQSLYEDGSNETS